jgi:hypothetical protein
MRFVHIELLFESSILPVQCLSIQCVKIEGLVSRMCRLSFLCLSVCLLFHVVIVAPVALMITL